MANKKGVLTDAMAAKLLANFPPLVGTYHGKAVTLHFSDPLSEIESEAHEETLDRIYQFDFMTEHGFKFNFLTGVFE
jgi:hypothetical protein